MSSTNKTANLKLHSWVRTDPVLCEDFNENFNKIDEVVGRLDVSSGNCEIYSGSYIGDGEHVKTLTFPKRPVYLVIQKGNQNGSTWTGFVVDGAYFYGHNSNSSYNNIFISGTTVTFQETSSQSANQTVNVNNVTYHYMAFAPAE